MPDTALLLLLDEVRGKTLRILEAVPARFARWAPPGLQNTILWHAGHAYVVVEALVMGALGRSAAIPDGWFSLFSWDSQPAAVPPERWPGLPEIVDWLREQHGRLRRVLGTLTQEQLDRPSARNPQRTVRFSILHSLHDEACHSGEMYLLLKIQARCEMWRPGKHQNQTALPKTTT
jgi:hypothetical protein